MTDPDPDSVAGASADPAAGPSGDASGAPRFAAHPGLAFDAEGAPFDLQYQDVFRSRAGAWREAQTVFVDGCRVRDGWRNQPAFCVLELGFGLGVNFLATLAAWRADPQHCRSLHFVSIEAHPLSAEDLQRGLATLGDDLAHSADLPALLAGWPLALPGLHRLRFAAGAVTLTLAFGDAARMLPRLVAGVDAFYLDGFAPSRNPAMWRPELMRALARLARPDARLATWSAAAAVRNSLAAAGFDVERRPGIGSKRHRIEARWAPRWPIRVRQPGGQHPAAGESAPALPEHRVMVIGAGLAGSAVAAGFARRGFAVELLDAGNAADGGSSTQPVMAEHLHLSADDNPTARLSRAALLLRIGLDHDRPGDAGRPPWGRLVMATTEQDAQAQAAMLARLAWPAAFVRPLDRQQASDVAGIALPRGGLWLPTCTARSPVTVIAGCLQAGGGAIRLQIGVRVEHLERDPASGQWLATDAAGRRLAAAPVVVLANAGDAPRLAGLASLSIRQLRGQTTWLRDPVLTGLRTVLGGDAYATPAGGDGRILVGASFGDGVSLQADPRDDLDNLTRLGQMLDRDPQAMAAGAHPAAVGFRYALPDRLPAIGPLPDEVVAATMAEQLIRNDRLPIPLASGLYGAFAFGSRGLLWATLAAELLPALVCGEPAPIERDLIAAIAPARLLRRQLRRGSR